MHLLNVGHAQRMPSFVLKNGQHFPPLHFTTNSVTNLYSITCSLHSWYEETLPSGWTRVGASPADTRVFSYWQQPIDFFLHNSATPYLTLARPLTLPWHDPLPSIWNGIRTGFFFNLYNAYWNCSLLYLGMANHICIIL